jgi:hypothetical protein
LLCRTPSSRGALSVVAAAGWVWFPLVLGAEQDVYFFVDVTLPFLSGLELVGRVRLPTLIQRS